MTNGSETVGHRIRHVRNIAKLSQAEFAKRIGTSQSHLSDVEVGRTPPKLRILHAILEKFTETDSGWLLAGMAAEPKTVTGAVQEDAPAPGVVTRRATSILLHAINHIHVLQAHVPGLPAESQMRFLSMLVDFYARIPEDVSIEPQEFFP